MNRIFVLLVLLVGCASDEQSIPAGAEAKTETKNVGYVSGICLMDLYDTEAGMSYEDVCRKLGGTGKPIQDQEQLQQLKGAHDEPTCKYFQWWDEDTRITLGFVDGKLQHYSEKLGS